MFVTLRYYRVIFVHLSTTLNVARKFSNSTESPTQQGFPDDFQRNNRESLIFLGPMFLTT